MSKKLLLADDSITIQKVIAITFANEDYELTVVDNGDAALEKARAMQPDLILADVFMPGKNGYELCAAIRQDPVLGGVPVLLLTGTFEPFDEGKARQAGANDWIAKPFESQGLIDRVEKLLAAVVAPVATAPMAPPIPPAPVAPVAVPAEVEDDMWGDFDAADEMGAAAVVAPPVEELEVDVEWASGFEPAEEEEVAAEEDIWGSVSFGEEDLSAPEGAAPATEDLWAPPKETAVSPVAPPVEEETFVFEEEETFSFDEEESAAPAAVPAWEDESEIFALGEEDILEVEDLEDEESEFIFEEEEAILGTPAALGGTPPAPVFEEEAAPDEEAFSFADEEPEWGVSPGPAVETPAAVPSAPGVRRSSCPSRSGCRSRPPVAPVVAPVSEESVARQVRELSDEDLARIVEKIAGAVVERLAEKILQQVAWEVVPDLAENLINDELRRIRAEVQK